MGYHRTMHALVAKRRHGRRPLWGLVAPIVVAAATAGCFGGGGGGGGGGDAGALLQRVNEVRAGAGLPALAWCPTLANAATAHATDMAVNGVQADPHRGSPPGSSTFEQRAAAHGYFGWTFLGENVAWGQSSVEQALRDLLASPTHAANIFHPAPHHAGFARVGNNWVQMFGANGTC